MSFAMLTEFNGQPIRQIKQDNKLWISLTDCAKASVANRSKLSEILKSNRFKEYLHTFGTMSEKSDVTNSHEIDTIIDDILLVITNSNKTNYELEPGTWLDISSENGQDILLFIAQMLSPMFHRWSNRQIRKLITNGYVISEKATDSQLVKAEAKIQKLKSEKKKLKTLANRQEREIMRMLPAHIEQKDLKTKITNEQDLSNTMHLLFCRLCKAYYAEYSIANELGVARFDSVRHTPQYTEIIEYKIGSINYKIADAELFGKKQYFAKIQSHFGNKPIVFKFMSPHIDEPELEEFIAEKQHLFGDTFRIEYCQLDERYFRYLKSKYYRRLRVNGLNFTQIESAWKLANCDELVQAILALA